MAAVRGSPVLRPCLSNVRSRSRRHFSSSSRLKNYDDTIQNLRINKDTRLMYQGFTGKVATGNAKESVKYGTNVVGGVTPGKSGEHIGLPLFGSVKEAKEKLKPDATAVFVPAPLVGKAIEEAIEAEIPLIVSVAEHIPLHDIMRITSILKTQSKSRFVGANTPGIIAPIHNCRIGFQPLPVYAPGHVGVVAKSGTLSYEAVGSITKAGLGQSLCVGMGGDIIAGTNFVDALKVFEEDPETHGIVLIGEVGGRAEDDAAEWIKDYHKRAGDKAKPISALVGGMNVPWGRIMGHAGAWAARGEHSSVEKYKLLQDAGCTMVDHPEKFGPTMKALLAGQSADNVSKIPVAGQQKRGYHTMMRRRPAVRPSPLAETHQQRRGLVIRPDQAKPILEPYLENVEGLTLTSDAVPTDAFYIGITVDRTERLPCIRTAPTTDVSQFRERAKRFPYDQREQPPENLIHEAIQHIALTDVPGGATETLAELIRALSTMYKEKEATTLSGSVSISKDGKVSLHLPSMMLAFDDSAFKSSKRQQDIHSLRQKEREQPEEVEAEKDGIVFVKLEEEDAKIGTIVNGAGLAMNTVDALRIHGGKATNFLDTGGKATSETIKKSFELILKDPRVKVIFVNIFGGLTDGGVMAEGILLAFKEVDMKNTPVVVRIRGTNEQAGQKKIAESGLGLEAFDGFAEAATRVVEIANERS